ncbi:MAG: hypothetical protein ACTSX6_08130 [Candidatus Heimdallarchaeaceae archaeon]
MRKFKEDIEIDEFNLDREWLRQAELYMEYAELAAKAQQKFRQIDEKLKVIRSELIQEAQEKLPKPIESNKEAYYRTHQRHKEAKEEYINAEYEADMYKNCLFALNHKKSALEYLVKLHCNNYNSSPQANDVDVEKAIEMIKAKKRKIRIKRASSRMKGDL